MQKYNLAKNSSIDSDSELSNVDRRQQYSQATYRITQVNCDSRKSQVLIHLNKMIADTNFLEKHSSLKPSNQKLRFSSCLTQAVET